MEILKTKYQGKGSEKQVAWAKSIFDKDLDRIKEELRGASSDSKTPQPIRYQAIIDVLADPNVIAGIQKFAGQSAGETIDYKGLRTPRGGVSIYSCVMQLVARKIA